ncbi:SRPBCC domain-containing protein [Kribbella sp.]|uniref:SRPBCC domain-containing protein n=1 Tax=Kribbella sp. TaxID=1871183 RepID=UPI002D653E31|nr:SRPBCC domain-containing protein [Kribbella sp.]HZX04176.1 SRPBCC domain-containing protein [Kribbella sp.]
MKAEFDPELDLVVERVMRAPRAKVWNAWSDPKRFERWWVPAPAVCRVRRLELRPGGGLVTELSDDGTAFGPHLDACFLVVEDLERLVFTNAINSTWRPAAPRPIAVTAEVLLADHADGTQYRMIARHGDPASRLRHADLGFADGWGTVIKQLATVVEG